MADRLRVVVVAPGRGSYTAREHGSLRRHDAQPDMLARRRELEGLIDAQRVPAEVLDLAALHEASFRSATHLRSENASSIIFACTLLDFLAVRDEVDVVAAGGNSLGWYTTLAVGGALSVEDAHRLVLEMSLSQGDVEGGQLLYPMCDEDWRFDPALARAARDAVECIASEPDAEAYVSIRLGGTVVLAGNTAGIRALEAALPAVERGPRSFPLRLALHGPFHTPLMRAVSERGRERLADLAWGAPDVPLIDGRGGIWSPYSADPVALRDYTLGTQVTQTFDFTATMRTALREFAPDALLLLGPGNSLGGPCGQVMATEEFRAISDRASFGHAQEDIERPLYSIGLAEELALLRRRTRGS